MKLYKLIAETVAWEPAKDWVDNRETQLRHIENNMLPSGSGIDSGTKISRLRFKQGAVRLSLEFHHMNENGYYDYWTEYTVLASPDLRYGFTLRIGGKDRDQIKDCLRDVYDACLRGEMDDGKLKKELWS